MAHVCSQLSLKYRLLWGIVPPSFGQLGFPGSWAIPRDSSRQLRDAKLDCKHRFRGQRTVEFQPSLLSSANDCGNLLVYASLKPMVSLRRVAM